MSKLKFILLIINAVFVIFVLPLAILDYVNFSIFFLISIGLVVIYFSVSRYEKIKLVKISKIYLDECDPIRYIEAYKKLLSRSILSKNAKVLNDITIALANISYGDIEEAKRTLDGLVESEPKFDSVLRFWYYKAWIFYFEETNEVERIKTLIFQSKQLVDRCPIKYKAQLISNYNQIIARYYIAANIHLNLAEQEFNRVFKSNFPKFNVVVNVYYLGVIAYLQKNYIRALEYFNSVAKNGNKLAVVNKSKNYIKLIENIQNNNENEIGV